ncbi:MAG: preprotein translocase subunit SecA [Candidatus Krumholzibacteriia bacterium]
MATGLLGWLEALMGKTKRDVARLQPMVDRIKEVRGRYAEMSDEELRGLRVEFRRRHEAGETLDDLMPEAFGVVWEACRRLAERKASWLVWDRESVWDMVPYDVQLMGAIVLHQGKIAEMATGEGKTLVAIMPLYLNSIPGKGAHLVTVNDYLARRDAEWMGGVLRFLGCDVQFITHDMTPAERRVAYGADITYGTNNEFGFDYLRDNMAIHPEQIVQREFFYAIVDEVDSVLIDEARTPLIISGAVDKSTHQFEALKPRVERVVRKQMQIVNDWIGDCERALRGADGGDDVVITDETALKLLRIRRGAPKNGRFRKLCQIPGVLETIQRTEEAFMRDKAMWEADADLLYVVEEKQHHVDFTERGRDLLAQEDSDFFVLPDLAVTIGEIETDPQLSPEEKARRTDQVERDYAVKNEQISNVDQLLRAYSLYERDDEYVVQEGKILIVDEFTGRLMPGRRFSEGLHQALEAKEGVKVEKETQTLATVTIQNFFRMYEKLAGMTGTAETEEAEFAAIYQLDVVVVPTNQQVQRVDYDDVVYKTKKEKYKAIVDEVERLHKLRLPVLVGTTTVESSELLSRLLRLRGINHNVLNAKHHKREAEIVEEAGRLGAVTIATNMAGRGTDIKIDPQVWELEERWPQDPNLEPELYEGEPLGLHIIGTERHESRRIDRQLRGRAGRQGDPGSGIFFLSLEDDLMRLFSPERIVKVMDRLGVQEGEVITHKMVTRAIEKAQVRVESHNFDIRKHLLKYDDVVNKQREVVYGLRKDVLETEGETAAIMDEYLESTIDRFLDEHAPENQAPDYWDIEGLGRAYQAVFLAPMPLEERDRFELGREVIRQRLREAAADRRAAKVERLGVDVARQLERFVLLQVIDEQWRDHLNQLILLRSGIGLRSYGQRDPLVEYKAESFRMFEELLNNVEADALRWFFRYELAAPVPQQVEQPKQVRAVHQEVNAYANSAVGAGAAGAAGAMAAGGSAGSGRAPQAEAPGARRPVQREEPKVGRNEPCPCGSGRKYKKCCGR